MGSLAYALGGALSGAGKGAAQVGQEASEQIMKQGLMRLQKQYQEELQQKGFEHETGMETQRETFQTGLTEKELQARGNISRAEMAQKEKLATQHETEATKRNERLAESRENVAGIRASATEAAANKPKSWQVKNVNVTSMVNGVPTTTSKPLLLSPSGTLYAQTSRGYVRWNTETNQPVYPEASFSRAPIDPSETQHLFADPTGTVPPGNKYSGMTNAEAFEAVHHFLPPGIGSRLTQPGAAHTAAAGDEPPSTTAEDLEDQQTVEGEDNSYANTGDRGPQQSDVTPAQ